MSNTTKQVTEFEAYEAMRDAQIEAERTTKPLKSSAELTAKDAEAAFNASDFAGCKRSAVLSLRYSVGVFHPAYGRHA